MEVRWNVLQKKVFFTLSANIFKVFTSLGWLAKDWFSFLENISINTANVFVPNLAEEANTPW